MARICLAAAICLALAGAAPGLSPTAADGPGVPKRTYGAGDFRTLSVIQAPAGFAHGACAMINGYLFVPYFKEGSRGGGFDFYDLSDPTRPVRVKRVTAPGIREPHTIASSSGYNADIIVLQGTDGVEFWNVSDPLNPFLVKHLALGGIGSSEFEGYAGVWWTFWQAPILYVGANADGLYVVDATDLQNPTQKRIPISSLGGFTVGSVFAVGNILYLASTENANADTNGNGRFTTLDISDPRNPRLIKTFAIPANGYSMLINGNKMLVGGVSQHFHTVDVSDPANLRKIDDINLGGSNGNYVSFQDGFAHAGFTTKVVKLDIRNPTIVNSGSGGSSISDKDFNFAIPLGNMVFAGNDHPAGSPLMVHQAAADNTGPSVNMVNPRNGATNQAVTSRVGLTFTDDVDLRSLSPASVVVRPAGGAALRGKYSVQQNVVSFFPDQALQPGTTYEVVVPAGGVKDWSGNGAPATFTSTFATSGASPPPTGGRDALLVVGSTTLTAGDALYRNRLQALGYAVQVVDDSAAVASQATGKDVVVISESCEVATGVGPRFRTVAVPIVTPELGIFGDLGMTTGTGTATGTTVTIADASHPLAAGLSGTVTVLSSSDRIHWGIPAASARRIATAPGTSNYAIFGYATGDAMVGLAAPARRVGFFPEDTAAAKLNANGGRLFDAAVTWADNIAPTAGVSCSIAPPAPRIVNQAATLQVQSSTGAAPLQFSWDFGDGSPQTAFSTSTTATHAYTQPGHYAVQLFARDATGATSGDTATQVIHYPTIAARPTSSSTILHTGSRVWVVNPDSNSVSAIDAISFLRVFETPVGRHPRTLALAPDNTVWVVNQDSATISVVSPTGAVVQTIALPAGSRPFGIAFGPNGAVVTLEATGRLLTLNPTSRAITSNVAVGPTPRGIAIGGGRVLVTRFISPDHRGEVVDVGTRTFGLAFDAGPDSERSGRGVPNYLSTIAISPDGRRAWIPSKKDNIARGQARDGRSLTFESTVRTIVSQIDLTTNAEGARLDINDHDLASAVAFSRNGDLAFVATQGTNTVQIVQVYDLRIIGQIRDVGLAPQGLVLEGNRLWVQGFMSRSVEVFDVSGVLNFTSNVVTPLATVDTNIEKLSPQVLRGKQIFYNAADRRMSRDGYISCASCHLDGGEDGRVWDFTDRGEGLRNTISLLGRRGTGHGNVHWTANFDEIQDFENDIRGPFGGLGFMTDTEFNTGTRRLPLGDRKAGVSADLDALSAYVSSLTTVPASPWRGADVSAGRAIFQAACATCHSGADFTDTLKHDGFDTPTLKGVWQTAPYLHDGSAATLTDVFTAGHGALTASQIPPVVEYVRQIDDLEAPAPGSRAALLVVGAPGAMTAGDTALRNRLQGLGFSVVVEGDGSTSSASASGKAVVVIAESVIAATLGSKFTNVAVPVVTSEQGGRVTSATVTIADPAHPMAAGLSGTVTVTTSAASLTSGTSARPVATAGGQAVLFGTDGAPARRVWWFGGNSAVPLLTADGWRLFDASVAWATSGSQAMVASAAPLEEAGAGWTGSGGGCGLLGLEIILIQFLVTAARRRQQARHGRRKAH